jgi:hypothetical protein
MQPPPPRSIQDGSYWGPPELEHERLQEMRECASQHLPNKANVVFLLAKSSNRNFAFYEYYETPESFGIKPRWAVLEAPRASDGSIRIEELSMAENLLLGVTVTSRPSGVIHVNFSPEQIRERESELILDAAGKPALVTKVDGHMCRLMYAYVQMQKTVLPDVDYITLYGTSLADGSVRTERMLNTAAASAKPWM